MVTFREKVFHKVIERELLYERGCSNPDTMFRLFEQSGVPIRNVCCRMHAAEKARLEAVSTVLGMSLQEFVSDAIQEAMTVALAVIQDRGMTKWFDSQWEEKLKAEKLRLVPCGSDPDQFSFESIKGEEEGK